MRQWGRPSDPAGVWSWLMGEEAWEMFGGVWFQACEKVEKAFYVLSVDETISSGSVEHTHVALVRYIDVGRTTYPEIMDVWEVGLTPMSEGDLSAIYRAGRGVHVTSVSGKDAVEAREAARKAVELRQAGEHPPDAFPKGGLSFAAKSAPLDEKAYAAGLKAGMSRNTKDQRSSLGSSWESGWRDGWEIAVGRKEKM